MTITIDCVSHRYGNRRALDNMSAQFVEGEITAILGPNGAGKSTLFKLIAGLLQLQHGEILINEWTLKNNRERSLEQMGFVFQEPALDTMRTGRENLVYAAGLHGLSKDESIDRIQTTSAMLRCEHVLDRKVVQLSGGERRRIEVARALIHHPKWLLLDEPSVGLDIDTRQSMSEDIHAMAVQRNMGVIWCTHIPDELAADDRLVIMLNGTISHSGRCGSLDSIRARYQAQVGPRE